MFGNDAADHPKGSVCQSRPESGQVSHEPDTAAPHVNAEARQPHLPTLQLGGYPANRTTIVRTTARYTLPIDCSPAPISKALWTSTVL